MSLTPPPWLFPVSPKVPRAREGIRVPTHKHTQEINHDVRERMEPRRGGGARSVLGTECRNLAWAEDQSLGGPWGRIWKMVKGAE